MRKAVYHRFVNILIKSFIALRMVYSGSVDIYESGFG